MTKRDKDILAALLEELGPEAAGRALAEAQRRVDALRADPFVEAHLEEIARTMREHPGMNATDAAAHVRAKHGEAPIVLTMGSLKSVH